MYTMKIKDDNGDMLLAIVGDDLKLIVKRTVSYMKGCVHWHDYHDLWAFLYLDNNGKEEFTQFGINVDSMFVCYNMAGKVVANARKGLM